MMPAIFAVCLKNIIKQLPANSSAGTLDKKSNAENKITQRYIIGQKEKSSYEGKYFRVAIFYYKKQKGVTL